MSLLRKRRPSHNTTTFFLLSFAVRLLSFLLPLAHDQAALFEVVSAQFFFSGKLGKPSISLPCTQVFWFGAGCKYRGGYLSQYLAGCSCHAYMHQMYHHCNLYLERPASISQAHSTGRTMGPRLFLPPLPQAVFHTFAPRTPPKPPFCLLLLSTTSSLSSSHPDLLRPPFYHFVISFVPSFLASRKTSLMQQGRQRLKNIPGATPTDSHKFNFHSQPQFSTPLPPMRKSFQESIFFPFRPFFSARIHPRQ